MRLKFPDAERQKILSASQLSLWSHEGAEALEYLRTERHLADDIIRQFQDGYCPAEFEHELSRRIVMPLCDPYGELIVFTSRDPKAPKRFQHWHESFDKTNYLYGLHIAKAACRRTDKAIVVEGQFDVQCLHSNDLTMTVGLCGTSFTIMHVALLSRYCSEIYLPLDPDDAGDAAISRALQMYHQYKLKDFGMTFIPIQIPNKMDPDDFVVEHGTKAFIDLMRKHKEKVVNG